MEHGTRSYPRITLLTETQLYKSRSERNSLLQEEISCHSKKYPVRGGSFLSPQEISYHRTKFLVKGRNFVSKEEIFSFRQKTD